MSKRFYFKQFNLACKNCFLFNQFSLVCFLLTHINVKTVLFQTIQFSLKKLFPFQTIQFSICTQCKWSRLFKCQIVLFQAILFSVNTQLSSIWLIDRILPLQATVDEGNNGNDGVFRIPQSSGITETSPSDCLMPYTGHSLEGLTLNQRCIRCIVQPQPIGQQFNDSMQA